MHETNHRYGLCTLCAAHCFWHNNSSGYYDPWIVFLKTDILAHQSGFAEHEERVRAAEAAEEANNLVGGWCPNLLSAVTEQLDRLLWNAPKGVPLEDLSLINDISNGDTPWWCDGVLRHMILHGNASGASMLMHILRHIQSLPLGGPAEWPGLVSRVAHACGMWRCFAPKPEQFDGVGRVAQETGYGIAFGEEERRACRDR
ncbi:hypothetical protein PG994_001236 [Apiospora phragmitis]|uniref:Uncharacterized protein n=1 Tax=Apiospora phragmitis TaxID=2905665 RepID=A0ABR1WSZ3_9PEZI